MSEQNSWYWVDFSLYFQGKCEASIPPAEQRPVKAKEETLSFGEKYWKVLALIGGVVVGTSLFIAYQIVVWLGSFFVEEVAEIPTEKPVFEKKVDAPLEPLIEEEVVLDSGPLLEKEPELEPETEQTVLKNGKPAAGVLEITVDAENSLLIYWDGDLQGYTPVTFLSSPGTFRLVAQSESSGFRYEKEVEVEGSLSLFLPSLEVESLSE